MDGIVRDNIISNRTGRRALSNVVQNLTWPGRQKSVGQRSFFDILINDLNKSTAAAAAAGGFTRITEYEYLIFGTQTE